MIHHILRIAERFTTIGALPCPQWVADALAAHERRRALVTDIACIAGPEVAFAALWLARWYAIQGGTVDGALRLFRKNLLR